MDPVLTVTPTVTPSSSVVGQAAGNWVSPARAGNVASTTMGLLEGVILRFPSCYIDGLAMYVSNAGTSAGSLTFRLGFYSLNQANLVGTLIADAGSVDATTAGVKVATFSRVKVPAGLVVPCAVLQGTAVLNPTSAVAGSNGLLVPQTTADFTSNYITSQATSANVTGALPTSLTFSYSNNATAPYCIQTRLA